jgi:hypothetical protein
MAEMGRQTAEKVNEKLGELQDKANENIQRVEHALGLQGSRVQ